MSRFSSESPYIFKNQKVQSYGDFEPIKVWSIIRHGTRLPSKKVISRYNGLAELKEQILQKSSSLTDQQRKAFERWTPMEIDLENQKSMTIQGEEEQFQLGKRFREKFPNFFDGNSKFTFKHTPTQRTELSAKKFIEGMFQNQENCIKSTVVMKNDPILRPYKTCEAWRKTVKKNKEVSLKERRKFEASEYVQKLVQEIREFTQINTITIYDLEVIYSSCAFEISWQYNLYNGQSVWCSLFNDQQLKMIEYMQDLKYYWIDGPGFEVTRKVACRTVEDILEKLDPLNPDKTLCFYFTHSGTILKLLTFFGLYQDDFDLTAENLQDNRKWKTSIIDTFSSNISVILYNSKSQGPHIQFMHQEQVVALPNCQTTKFGMCSWEDFKNFYAQKLEK